MATMIIVDSDGDNDNSGGDSSMMTNSAKEPPALIVAAPAISKIIYAQSGHTPVCLIVHATKQPFFSVGQDHQHSCTSRQLCARIFAFECVPQLFAQ